MQPYQLLIIASQLAVLTYYIGVLLYSLPIPDYRVKRWAPILVRDGIWMAVLVAAYSMLLEFSDLLASYSGYSLSAVARLSDEIISIIYSYNFIVRLLATIVSIVPGLTANIVYVFAFPLMFTQYTVLWAAVTILSLTLLVAAGKALLAALGIALMAIPFRIGRSAGASLLAFALAANAMLPYFPLWLETVAGIMGVSYAKLFSNTITYYTVWGVVKDEYGGYPSNAAIIFRKIDGNKTFIYKVREDGTYIISIPYYLEAGSYAVYLEYMAAMISLHPLTVKIPDSLTPSYQYVGVDYRLDFTASTNVVFTRPYGLVLLPRSCSTEYVHVGSSVTTITLYCPYNWSMLTVRLPEKCMLSIALSNARISSTREKLIPWRGVMVKEYQYMLAAYGQPISISLTIKCGGYTVEPYIKPGISRAEVSSSIITYIIISLLVYPIAVFSYISIIAMVVLSIARIMGAIYPRVVFDL